MEKTRDVWRYILLHGWFVWMAWATAGHGGLITHLFGGMLLTLLLIEVLLFWLAFHWGFGQRMADNMLERLPVPLRSKLLFDVAFTAWLAWLGHCWLLVAAYAATQGIAGWLLMSAWARGVEARTWGGEK